MLSCGMVEIPLAALGTPIIGGLAILMGLFSFLAQSCPDPRWISIAWLLLILLVILLLLWMRALVCPMIWIAAVVLPSFFLRLAVTLAQG